MACSIDNAANSGQDALIVGERLTEAGVSAVYHACFDKIEQLAPVTVHQGGTPVAQIQLFLGKRYTPQGRGAPCNAPASSAGAAGGVARYPLSVQLPSMRMLPDFAAPSPINARR